MPNIFMIIYKFKHTNTNPKHKNETVIKRNGHKESVASSKGFVIKKKQKKRNQQRHTSGLFHKLWTKIRTNDLIIGIVAILPLIFILLVLSIVYKESPSRTITVPTSSETESQLPAKWEATVNKDNPNVNFSSLRNEYFQERNGCVNIYLGDECIAYGLSFADSWPAYECCIASQTKTYDLTIQIVNLGKQEVIETIPFSLTVEQ